MLDRADRAAEFGRLDAQGARRSVETLISA
jgi:hypothetical protein